MKVHRSLLLSVFTLVVEVVRAASDATRRRSDALLALPALDCRERVRDGLSAAARRAGMDDPTLVVELDEEGVERDQQVRQGECRPATLGLDLDRRVGFVVQLALLDSLAYEPRIGSSTSVCGDRPINRESRPHPLVGGASRATWGG